MATSCLMSPGFSSIACSCCSVPAAMLDSAHAASFARLSSPPPRRMASSVSSTPAAITVSASPSQPLNPFPITFRLGIATSTLGFLAASSTTGRMSEEMTMDTVSGSESSLRSVIVASAQQAPELASGSLMASISRRMRTSCDIVSSLGSGLILTRLLMNHTPFWAVDMVRPGMISTSVSMVPLSSTLSRRAVESPTILLSASSA
mmetsp:Transcript_32012/g.82922  ORF Transcript_32012/g.82922 Transcript_32012/m.82922 type:complete len:205 (+) Transcript_32012:313-927(+)